MRLFAISDLHLSGACDKPMDIFGAHWNNHWERIQENWIKAGICADDTVLISGDTSWAMHLDDALVDIMEIAALPGKKVLIRGNHDYWWSSVSRVRAALPAGMYVLQNDSIELDGRVLCGTRGWTVPGSTGFKADDKKIYDREVLRMELALKSARGKEGEKTVLIHYPPFDERQQPSGFTELFAEYGVSLVVYGHLHGKSCHASFSGVLNGVEYVLASCDHLKLAPIMLRGR